MNREGIVLLSALIDRVCHDDIANGDCKAIAVTLSSYMPADMTIAPSDVYEAIKDKPEYRRPTVNLELLREAIDETPVLYSARLFGGHQAILNELRGEFFDITIDDVAMAMGLRSVPQPKIVAAGAVTLRGQARLG